MLTTAKLIYAAIASLDGYVVDAGKQCLPTNIRLNLELLNVRQFANGTVYLRYRVDNY